MQFSIERERIVKRLTTVCGIVERRHALPILFNVLLAVEDSQLSLTATDLEVEIKTTVEVQRAEAGKITVAARKLLDICRMLPHRSTLDVHYEKGKFHIHSGHSQFMLGTLPAEDFPNSDEFDILTVLELNQAELKWLLDQTVFCMAHQDVRYYLNGLLLELSTKTIHVAATDGHRLAVACLEKESLSEGVQIQSIIPRKAVLELGRLLEESDEPVRLKFGTNQMEAEFQGLSFSTKLIDGPFPDYKRVIPIGCEKQLVADREAFRQALMRVNILTSDKYRGVRLGLSSSKLRVNVTNLEQESAEEELEVSYEGEEFEIAFNNSYLIDVFNIINTEQIKMEFTDANNSCLITAVNKVGGKYVVMPMRL